MKVSNLILFFNIKFGLKLALKQALYFVPKIIKTMMKKKLRFVEELGPT